MDQAFEYAKDHALETEQDYSYTAKDGTCQAAESKGRVKVTSFADVTTNDPDALKAAVAEGVVSVAIEADTFVFQFYNGGVLNSKACGTNLDHGVAVVGYGVDSKKGEYWIVRNSWGPSWGDKGYIKIANTGSKDAGICGINSQPSIPTAN